jgi:hypothetical protein
VADSVDGNGVVSSWVVHIDETGAATWIPLAVPGASVTSANSIYGGTELWRGQSIAGTAELRIVF